METSCIFLHLRNMVETMFCVFRHFSYLNGFGFLELIKYVCLLEAISYQIHINIFLIVEK